MKGKGEKTPTVLTEKKQKEKEGEVGKKMESGTFTLPCQKSLAAASSRSGHLPGGILCAAASLERLTKVPAFQK